MRLLTVLFDNVQGSLIFDMGAWIWGEQGSSLGGKGGGEEGGRWTFCPGPPWDPPRMAAVGEIHYVGVSGLWRSQLNCIYVYT